MLSKTCLQENKNDSTIQTYDLVVLQKLYPYASMCYIYKNGADFTSTRCSETRPPPPPTAIHLSTGAVYPTLRKGHPLTTQAGAEQVAR